MSGWRLREWTNEERALSLFLAEVTEAKARHRATGCRVFDDPIAKCTCPKADDD